MVMLGYLLYSVIPQRPGEGFFTATSLSLVIFYSFLLGITTFTMFWYIAMGRNQSTVIPCLTSFLYDTYTVILSLMGLSLIVIGALETAKAPNGHYTTVPVSWVSSRV